MAKPRISIDRQLLGVLGRSVQSSMILTHWNRLFRVRRIDASMDRYACSAATLPERLSEMLHFDRRGYIVTFPLQQAILPLLDRLDPSALEQGRVDIVVNDDGVLTGHFVDGAEERQWSLMIEKGSLESSRAQDIAVPAPQ
jgi:shikimate 5-dehydrogenase